MTTRRSPKPPKHLKLATRRWFTWVLENFDMEEHHVKVLTAACESWDRMQQAREAIGKHGITYEDRFGAPKPRPEVAIERDAKIGFSRMVRELRLDLDAPESRPPGLERG
jgi:P27 family predicted phage terminase small subunit